MSSSETKVLTIASIKLRWNEDTVKTTKMFEGCMGMKDINGYWSHIEINAVNLSLLLTQMGNIGINDLIGKDIFALFSRDCGKCLAIKYDVDDLWICDNDA